MQCSALQCSVVRCSALQCSAVRYSKIKISKPTQVRAVDLFLFSVCIFYGPNTKNFKRNIFCPVPACVQTSVQRATAVTKDRSAFNSAQTSWFLVLTEKSPPLATRLLREKGGLTLWWEREYVVNFFITLKIKCNGGLKMIHLQSFNKALKSTYFDIILS